MTIRRTYKPVINTISQVRPLEVEAQKETLKGYLRPITGRFTDEQD